jgi:hypothetical protein
MNSPARRFGPLPPVPPELLGALRGALDLAFALTTPDAVIVGPVTVPTPVEPTPTLPGRPMPRNEPGVARVALLVLHEEPWRQRVLRRVGNLLAEFSINADTQTRRDLADESATGRPTTAHWLAAGSFPYDPLGRGRTLAEHAAHLLARGYKPSEAEQSGRRVQALMDLHEARSRVASDPIAAQLMLGRTIEQIIDFAFAANGRWLPPPAERRSALAQADRGAAVLLEACFQGFDLAANVRAAERFADKVLGARMPPDWIGPRVPAATSGL